MTCMQDFARVMDVLCPMHVVLDPTGHIQHAGPTVWKLTESKSPIGTRFLELFELKRPRAVTSMEQLLKVAGVKLHMCLRAAPQTGIKGVLVPLPDAAGAVVNLSFGISIINAVRDYALTAADFAATDLTVEMLYLVEAKSAAMEASRKLNKRLQGAMIAAEEQAFTDTLTGLKNRRALEYVVPRLLAEGTAFGLMHIDLDFFKAVNDTLGHAAGDHVLQRVARILVDSSRDEDCVARVGGDEFVMVARKVTKPEILTRIARRIIEEIEKPVLFEDTYCTVSASIGIAVHDGAEPSTLDQLMADSDVALYASKHRGRATCTVFAPDLRDTGPLARSG